MIEESGTRICRQCFIPVVQDDQMVNVGSFFIHVDCLEDFQKDLRIASPEVAGYDYANELTESSQFEGGDLNLTSS